MKRLSLAELKAKTNVVAKTEFITGGNGGEDGCHFTLSFTATSSVTGGIITGRASAQIEPDRSLFVEVSEAGTHTEPASLDES